MQVTSNSGMWLDAFHLTSENSKNLDRGHGDETGYPDRTKHNICLYICGGPLSVIQGGTEHPGRQSTHLSKDTRWTLASQCIMTCTTQRAKINKPIIWSVTPKILESVCLGLSLPLVTLLSAKNVLLVQQKLVVLKYFASSFMKLSVKKQLIPAQMSPRLTKSALICPHSNKHQKVC